MGPRGELIGPTLRMAATLVPLPVMTDGHLSAEARTAKSTRCSLQTGSVIQLNLSCNIRYPPPQTHVSHRHSRVTRHSALSLRIRKSADITNYCISKYNWVVGTAGTAESCKHYCSTYLPTYSCRDETPRARAFSNL